MLKHFLKQISYKKKPFRGHVSKRISTQTSLLHIYIYITVYKVKWVGCGVWYLLAWLCTEDLLYLRDKTWPQWADLIVWPECRKKWGVVRGLEQPWPYGARESQTHWPLHHSDLAVPHSQWPTERRVASGQCQSYVWPARFTEGAPWNQNNKLNKSGLRAINVHKCVICFC